MPKKGPVLVATALGEGSDEALRQGVEIARAQGVPCVACHALPEILGIRPLFPQLQEVDRETGDRLRTAATAMYERQARRVLGPHHSVPQLRLDAGTAHSVILATAEESGAGLIVVGGGSHPGHGSGGGVAEHVVRHAHCPVLVARQRSGGPVLAATDFSDRAMPAVAAGAAEAQRRGLPLALVHVVDLFIPTSLTPEGDAYGISGPMYEAYIEHHRKMLQSAATRHGATGGTQLRVGLAEDEILAAARELKAELLVVGTHGRSGLMRMAMGSVAEAVVRGATTSLLVVRLQG